jgi:hypothetical protein
MYHRKLVATVTADSGYLEPAIYTALSLRECILFERVILLIKEDVFLEQRKTELAHFFESNLTRNIEIITFSDFLPPISYAHFSNAIVYKLFSPYICGLDPSTLYVNFDAGILAGENFGDFLGQLIGSMESSMGCYIHSKNSPIHESLLPYIAELGWNEDKYASGVVLAFDSGMYRHFDLATKFLSLLRQHYAFLMNADQEITMLAFNERDIYKVSSDHQVVIKFLQVDLRAWEAWDDAELSRCAWWKVCGTVKPWKYWCIDQNKYHYLSRARSVNAAIYDHLPGFLKELRWQGYERYLGASLETLHKNYSRGLVPPLITRPELRP